MHTRKDMLTRDEQRLDWMRQMPCIICLIKHGKQADLSNCQAEPHHIPADGMGKVAKKTSDYRTIPLCRSHHNEVHWIGKHSFQAKYSVDFEYLIREFNRIWEERNENVRSGH
jgi:hypothetical protein